MHTVQLLLKTSKYERHEIDRRFHALAHLHNVCVKHAHKCMIRLQHDKRYAELRQYREKCEYEFEHFADVQDQLILKMKENGLSMRQCFGF